VFVTAKIVPPTPTPRQVVLTMDEDTARVLVCITGEICGSGDARSCVSKLFSELRKAGIAAANAKLSTDPCSRAWRIDDR